MTTHAAPRSPELARDFTGFEKLRDRVQELGSKLNDEQFAWRPAAGRWSVGECIGHLLKSGPPALEAIDDLIEQAKARDLRSDGPFSHGFIGNAFVRMMEPPYRMKSKTGDQFRPEPSPRTEQIAAFVAMQHAFMERAIAADGLDLAGVRRTVFGPIKFTLGQWFAFTGSHSRRHVWQAEQVMAEPSFPAR